MKYTDIYKNFNVLLAGDNLMSRDILPHLDYTIDMINETLNTVFPTFSEWANTPDDNGALPTEYNLFPDKYIRTVCLNGAAWHYYVTDEEGLATAPQYQQDFQHFLFTMQRDMLYSIDEEYMASDYCGTVQCAEDHWNLGARGIETQSDSLI